MLEQSDIAHYLLSLGIVKPRSVIEEDVSVIDTSRRNCVFLVTRRSGPTLVVKQALPGEGAALANEAAILRLLAGARELSGSVPAVVHEEADGARLVLSTAPGGRDWGVHHGRFPRIPARVLGRLLGALHRLPADVARAPHPILRVLLPDPPHELVVKLGSGAGELVARIQASDFICGRLAELRAADHEGALVHGDLRWENCLAFPAPGSRRRTRVVLVDWEYAGRADAAIDVGTLLAEYLRAWLRSVPIVEAGDPGRLVARARLPLRSMRPAIGAFWSAYKDSNPHPPPLRRSVEIAAALLLQTAVERVEGAVAPTAQVMTLVQLAENMLRSPDDAAAVLLGLRA